MQRHLSDAPLKILFTLGYYSKNAKWEMDGVPSTLFFLHHSSQQRSISLSILPRQKFIHLQPNPILIYLFIVTEESLDCQSPQMPILGRK